MRHEKILSTFDLVEKRNQIKEQLEKIEKDIAGRNMSNPEVIKALTAQETLVSDFKAITMMLENGYPVDMDREIIRIKAKLMQAKGTWKYQNSWSESLKQLEFLIDSPELPEEWGMKGLRLYRGKPITFGAFSGVGKSTFLRNLIFYYLVKNKNILVFSNEMLKGEYIAGLIQAYAFLHRQIVIPLWEIIRNGDSFGYLQKQWQDKLIIYDQRMTASEIVAFTEIVANDRMNDPAKRIDMVFIDYLQKIKPEKHLQGANRKDKLDETVDILCQGARDTQLPFIQAAQTNRSSNKDGIDDPSTFEGSGEIEKNSALCGIITKPPKDKDALIEGDFNNARLVNFSKNRFGPEGKVKISLEPKIRMILGGQKYE